MVPINSTSTHLTITKIDEGIEKVMKAVLPAYLMHHQSWIRTVIMRKLIFPICQGEELITTLRIIAQSDYMLKEISEMKMLSKFSIKEAWPPDPNWTTST